MCGSVVIMKKQCFNHQHKPDTPNQCWPSARNSNSPACPSPNFVPHLPRAIPLPHIINSSCSTENTAAFPLPRFSLWFLRTWLATLSHTLLFMGWCVKVIVVYIKKNVFDGGRKNVSWSHFHSCSFYWRKQWRFFFLFFFKAHDVG